MSQLKFECLDQMGVKFSRLVTDSRQIKVGDTFVAYPGTQRDGRQFIPQAIANGANAVIWEAENFEWNTAWRVPNLPIAGLQQRAGEIADYVYGAPSQKLAVIGVTGTNGKTSCSQWIANALNFLNKRSAVIGTLGNGFPDALQPTLNTTPEAITVHGLLAEYLQEGAQAVVMEVSSHALSLGRVNAVHFDTALFTNLTRDHLDFHGDMASYAAAKRQLFDRQNLRVAVLNLDDEAGREWIKFINNQGVGVIGYGLSETARQTAEQLGIRFVLGESLSMNAQGMHLSIQSSWGSAALHSCLLGRFNASNLLGSLAVLLALDINLSDAVQALAMQQAVAGRMQTLNSLGKPTVVIDFAHTPDALEKVLQTLREVTVTSGKVICVFGCGGDRDVGKRPLMGKVASQLAEMCVVTSDNPRSENPQVVIDQIVAGMSGATQIILERSAAICASIAQAKAGDTVLLAGKGHEHYQEIAGVKYPFSDADWAQRALAVWPSPLSVGGGA
jgi:UDP-N-acetylmuramoyl-L-alanyl-D-glutamate--2,6-diaminopimelate ligase